MHNFVSRSGTSRLGGSARIISSAGVRSERARDGFVRPFTELNSDFHRNEENKGESRRNTKVSAAELKVLSEDVKMILNERVLLYRRPEDFTLLFSNRGVPRKRVVVDSEHFLDIAADGGLVIYKFAIDEAVHAVDAGIRVREHTARIESNTTNTGPCHTGLILIHDEGGSTISVFRKKELDPDLVVDKAIILVPIGVLGPAIKRGVGKSVSLVSG